MGKLLAEFVRDGLLALGVLLGPLLWLGGLVFAFAAWEYSIRDTGTMLFGLLISFWLMCWASWGLVTGLRTLPRLLLGLGSILTMITGVAIFVSGEPLSRPIGLLFLGYSLIEFIACRRPRVHVVS